VEPRAEACSTVLTNRSDEASAFASGMSDVAANEEVTDEPVVPGVIVRPVSLPVDPEETGRQEGLSGKPEKLVSARAAPASAEEAVVMKAKYDNQQRMIREIAANQLLQEELAKSDPNLVFVVAFMSKVCGTDRRSLKLKETAESEVQGGISTKEKTVAPIMSSTDTVGCTEKVVAPIINVEASEDDTQLAVAGEGECGAVARITATVATMRDVPANTSDVNVEGEAEVIQEPDESDAISIADTVMSVGGSSSEGSRSHSTCGSSVSTSGTRKRVADELPERDCEGSS